MIRTVMPITTATQIKIFMSHCWTSCCQCSVPRKSSLKCRQFQSVQRALPDSRITVITTPAGGDHASSQFLAHHVLSKSNEQQKNQLNNRMIQIVVWRTGFSSENFVKLSWWPIGHWSTYYWPWVLVWPVETVVALHLEHRHYISRYCDALEFGKLSVRSLDYVTKYCRSLAQSL